MVLRRRAGDPAHVLADRALPGQIGLGEHGEPQRRVDEAVVESATGDMDHGRADLGQVGVEAGGDALAAEDLHRAGRRAVGLRHIDRAPAVRDPLLGVGQRPLGVAPVGLRRVHAELEGLIVQVGFVGRERRDRPPHHAELAGPVADVRDAPQRGRADVDRGVPAAGRRRPGGLEELLAGRHQVGRPGAHPLRVADDGHRALRQYVEQQLHLVDQDRRQRLHALDRDALRDLAEQLAQLRVRLGQGGGPPPHLVGEQQLAAGRRPQPVLGDFQRALVRDLEVPDLLDVVAPELDPERVLLGRREDVQDAAPDRELAALLDQFDPGVRGRRQAFHDLVQIRRLPAAQRHRLQVPQPLDLRLEHRADRRDHHADRARRRVVVPGVRQAAQHGEPAAHRVAAGREALVRQRLPGRVLRHLVGGQQRAQRRRQVLRLAPGRGHREHRAPGLAGQRGHREGPRGGRADQVDVHPVAVGGGLHRFGERRVSYHRVQQTVQAHEGLPSRGEGNANRPTRHTGRGIPSVRRGCDSRARSKPGGARGRDHPFGGTPRQRVSLCKSCGTP